MPAGHKAHLNPVTPEFPAHYVPGQLHLESQKAVEACRRLAIAAKLPAERIRGIKLIE